MRQLAAGSLLSLLKGESGLRPRGPPPTVSEPISPGFQPLPIAPEPPQPQPPARVHRPLAARRGG